MQNNNLYFITFAYNLLHVSTNLVHHQIPAITRTFDVCGTNPHREDDLNEGIQNDKFGNKNIHNSPQECTFDAFVSVHSSIMSDKLCATLSLLYSRQTTRTTRSSSGMWLSPVIITVCSCESSYHCYVFIH
jgi:hypothetical protein